MTMQWFGDSAPVCTHDALPQEVLARIKQLRDDAELSQLEHALNNTIGCMRYSRTIDADLPRAQAFNLRPNLLELKWLFRRTYCDREFAEMHVRSRGYCNDSIGLSLSLCVAFLINLNYY